MLFGFSGNAFLLSPVNDQENITNTWQQRYLDHDTPWDRGLVNPNVRDFVQLLPDAGATLIDIGCGTGTHSVWMASQGLLVTGIDIAPKAIEIAASKADEAGVSCRFITGDFFEAALPASGFDAALDSGCFHVFDSNDDRTRFAEKLSRLLVPGGYWLSLVSSADTPPRSSGPPQRSAREIVYAVEPWFEILSLRVNPYEGMPYKFWIVLMQNRQPY
jgi:ubiquinone/menaquinone biosynthesis C-methylase UbiE